MPVTCPSTRRAAAPAPMPVVQWAATPLMPPGGERRHDQARRRRDGGERRQHKREALDAGGESRPSTCRRCAGPLRICCRSHFDLLIF
jgi:hypothetical protein